MKEQLKRLIPPPRWRDILGLVVSAAFLWATLRQTSGDILQVRFSVSEWGMIGASVFLMGAVLWVQGQRMRWFLAPKPWRLEGIHGFRSVTIGSLYNAILPGNLGEAVKLHHFASRNNIRFRTALACWVGEKLVEGTMMACMSALLLLVPNVRASFLGTLLSVPIALAIACCLVVVMSYWWPLLTRGLFRLVPTARAALFLYRVFLEFRWRLLGRGWRFRTVAFVAGGLIIGAMNFVAFFLNMKAGGIAPELIRPENLLLLMILTAVIYFVPSAPSSVGVMHYGIYASLTVMAEMQGLIPTSAMKDSFVLTAIIFHATYVLPELVLGSIHLYLERRVVFSSSESFAATSLDPNQL
jgi:hypothetical protein